MNEHKYNTCRNSVTDLFSPFIHKALSYECTHPTDSMNTEHHIIYMNWQFSFRVQLVVLFLKYPSTEYFTTNVLMFYDCCACSTLAVTENLVFLDKFYYSTHF